jgi:hypothetical protein
MITGPRKTLIIGTVIAIIGTGCAIEVSTLT